MRVLWASINLKKPKAMGITVPHPLLGHAYEVIERHCHAAAHESASGPKPRSGNVSYFAAVEG